MSETFKPLGERARWRVIYDLFRAAKIDETVTYDQMAKAIGVNPDARHPLQMAARRASLELEQVDKRAVDAVKNVGYRVVQHREVLGLTRRRNRKAGTQLTRGSVTAQAVDLNEVDDEVRRGLETLARALAAQSEINRSVGKRLVKHERVMEGMDKRIETLEERLRRIEEQS